MEGRSFLALEPASRLELSRFDSRVPRSRFEYVLLRSPVSSDELVWSLSDNSSCDWDWAEVLRVEDSVDVDDWF